MFNARSGHSERTSLFCSGRVVFNAGADWLVLEHDFLSTTAVPISLRNL